MGLKESLRTIFSPEEKPALPQLFERSLVSGSIPKEVYDAEGLGQIATVIGDYTVAKKGSSLRALDREGNLAGQVEIKDTWAWVGTAHQSYPYFKMCHLVGTNSLFLDLHSTVDTMRIETADKQGTFLDVEEWEKIEVKGSHAMEIASDHLRKLVHNHPMLSATDTLAVYSKDTHITVVPLGKNDLAHKERVMGAQGVALRQKGDDLSVYYVNHTSTRLKHFSVDETGQKKEETIEEELPEVFYDQEIRDILFGHALHDERPWLSDIAIINHRNAKSDRLFRFTVMHLPSMKVLYQSPDRVRAIGMDLSGNIRAVTDYAGHCMFELDSELLQTIIEDAQEEAELMRQARILNDLEDDLKSKEQKRAQKQLEAVRGVFKNALMGSEDGPYSILSHVPQTSASQDAVIRIYACRQIIAKVEELATFFQKNNHVSELLGHPLSQDEAKVLVEEAALPYRQMLDVLSQNPGK